MNSKQQPLSATDETSSRNWLKLLRKYREPDLKRSILELIITGVPFIVLWIAAWWSLSISYWLTVAIIVPAALFLVRLFLIQHDCGHGAFFKRKGANDWVGRVLGIFTMTPYDVWRRAHAIHHATSGDLSRRGLGDIDTLTIREFSELSTLRKIIYRAYRHPIVLFVIGPSYEFLLRNRLPAGFKKPGSWYWISAMGTNLSIALVITVMIYLVGAGPFLLVQLPIVALAASIGVWLFYVQHQFEDTFWAENEDWDHQDAALYGSSYYDLPGVLRWFTANIGVHHVHHLYSRIPYYRLHKVIRDYPELGSIRRLTFWKSLSCAKLRLWDEGGRKLVSFAKAKKIIENF